MQPCAATRSIAACMLGTATLLPAMATAQALDRTVLPIQLPTPPTTNGLDVLNSKPPTPLRPSIKSAAFPRPIESLSGGGGAVVADELATHRFRPTNDEDPVRLLPNTAEE